MKLFTVNLTEDERAKLETHRARLGCRSQADVIRYWIELLPRAPEVSTGANLIDTYTTPGRPKPKPALSFMKETNETVERPPLGSRKRVMARDPKSNAPIAVWCKLVGYKDDKPIWKPE
jgi:hypothetical protein